MTDRFKATTASPEAVDAVRKFMKAFAESLSEGETFEQVYKSGNARVTRQDGRFHAAIDVAIEDLSGVVAENTQQSDSSDDPH